MSRVRTRAAARVLSKLGAAKGGRARAEKLSPARRRGIAQEAAAKRWGKPSPAMQKPLCIRCRQLIGFQDAGCVPGLGWFCVACIRAMWTAETPNLRASIPPAPTLDYAEYDLGTDPAIQQEAATALPKAIQPRQTLNRPPLGQEAP